MKETLKEDLRALTCVDNVATLPTKPLNNYAELKNVLTKACGKYKRNTFVFPTPAKDVVNTLVGGKTINFKKEFQFFATPPELADLMCEQIVGLESGNVLEPSAGHGALIEALRRVRDRDQMCIHAVELSDLNFKVLSDKYGKEWQGKPHVKLIKGDFLTVELDGKFDLVIANPPFTKNQDIDHIRKMYSLLEEDGQLITVASQSWVHGSHKKQVEFKEWLNEIGATWQEIDKGAFKSSGTNVSAVLITVHK